MKNSITDIHCPNCGASAEFDIVRQEYLCGYCGGKIQISDALREKQGFRTILGKRIRSEAKKYRLLRASCNNCGADVIFEEGSAISKCAFCGRDLVRRDYLGSEGMPECIIPFQLTREEAAEMLSDWCGKNKRKPEAKKLRSHIDDLRGVYLPYDLVRGPVHMKVSRMDGGSTYRCEGFLNSEFINRSARLDNLLLDGMEPYDCTEMEEFDFAYVSGQCVKISDIADKELKERANREAEKMYAADLRKVMQTKAVDVKADVSSAVRLPVLLPVYYICRDDMMAAVNGQTGKVSVRAEKESHFIFLPWWLKAVLSTVLLSVISLGSFILFGMEPGSALMITGILAAFFMIVTLCVFSDTTKNRLIVGAGRQIFTSGERTYRRIDGKLAPYSIKVENKAVHPVFFSKINGTEQTVLLKFATPGRILRMLVLSLIVLFLPVIIALFLNGFNFSDIHLGGSAVWFCIMVPVVPVCVLKLGLVEMYDKPLIYIRTEEGKRYRRYRQKTDFREIRECLLNLLAVFFVPPLCFAIWLTVISFCVICYLTAFG